MCIYPSIGEMIFTFFAIPLACLALVAGLVLMTLVPVLLGKLFKLL